MNNNVWTNPELRKTTTNKIIIKKNNNNEDWRKKRIALIKKKEYEDFKQRTITSEFAQAIQDERSKAKLSIKDLSLKLMISEKNLINFENGIGCPTAQTIVKLRTLFDNLPKKYYYTD